MPRSITAKLAPPGSIGDHLHAIGNPACLDWGKRALAGDTQDAEGEVVARRPVAVTAAMVDAALAQFRGDIQQVPPFTPEPVRSGQEKKRSWRPWGWPHKSGTALRVIVKLKLG